MFRQKRAMILWWFLFTFAYGDELSDALAKVNSLKSQVAMQQMTYDSSVKTVAAQQAMVDELNRQLQQHSGGGGSFIGGSFPDPTALLLGSQLQSVKQN